MGWRWHLNDTQLGEPYWFTLQRYDKKRGLGGGWVGDIIKLQSRYSSRPASYGARRSLPYSLSAPPPPRTPQTQTGAPLYLLFLSYDSCNGPHCTHLTWLSMASRCPDRISYSHCRVCLAQNHSAHHIYWNNIKSCNLYQYLRQLTRVMLNSSIATDIPEILVKD